MPESRRVGHPQCGANPDRHGVSLLLAIRVPIRACLAYEAGPLTKQAPHAAINADMIRYSNKVAKDGARPKCRISVISPDRRHTSRTAMG